MKKFKEYLGEAFFKVRIPDVAPTFIEADSASQVKQNLRKILKPDVIKELESLVIPMLKGLMKNAEKEYIYWPNRTPILEKQIEKVYSITRPE